MKRPIIDRVLSLMTDRLSNTFFLEVNYRVHEKDFNRNFLSKTKFIKGRCEFIYVYNTSVNIKIGHEFDVIFPLDDPLNFFESKTKVLEIYDSRTGNERVNIQGFHNNCLIEFTDGVPDSWDKVAYILPDYAAPKRVEYVFANKKTMSHIVKLYRFYYLFEKLEEESSNNIILAIDSIATDKYYNLPENILQKKNNFFVCVEGVRSVEVVKDIEFDVVFTLDNIYAFIECKSKIIDFYKEDGTIVESIPKYIHSLEACHLEFEKEVPNIWNQLCLDTDNKELKYKSEVVYLTSSYTMLRLLELLEDNKIIYN